MIREDEQIDCHAKRKSINDYFIQKRKPRCSSVLDDDTTSREEEPFQEKEEKQRVPDLTLIPDFISPTEESGILSFLNDPIKCTWRTDLSRRTMHFGGTYCLMPSPSFPSSPSSKPTILQAPPMPPELSFLIDRMVDAAIFPPNKTPQYCIVNEYIANQGISAHTENFAFGEPVVGLSLLDRGEMRFHELKEAFDGSVRSGKAGKAEKTGRREDVAMPGRSLLVMRGESRWKWQHEVVRSKRGRGEGWKRISLTFRGKEGG